MCGCVCVCACVLCACFGLSFFVCVCVCVCVCRKGYTEPRVTASVAPADFEPTDFQTTLPLPQLQHSAQDTDMQAVHCADATATADTATAAATTATATASTATATTSSIARWAVLMSLSLLLCERACVRVVGVCACVRGVNVCVCVQERD